MVASSQGMSLPLCQILSVFWIAMRTPSRRFACKPAICNEIESGLRQGLRRETQPASTQHYSREVLLRVWRFDGTGAELDQNWIRMAQSSDSVSPENFKNQIEKLNDGHADG